MTDTIFALSSGLPPAAIAILRVSGPKALETLETLSGIRPEPRQATLATLRSGGDVLDRALVLRFDGPGTVTGEDLVELHLHGGRAVVAAVAAALAALEGVRPAEPGEFTRRAFMNGKLDLTQVEGLADLLAAETEGQRRAALRQAEGGLSQRVAGWTDRTLALAARIEAQLDFSDEGDVAAGLSPAWEKERGALVVEIEGLLARPAAERLRDGVRVVIAGPPNSGKSTLLNALVEREAAITSDRPGTTRDLIEASVAMGGIPFVLVDSAGIRNSADRIEVIGIGRAEAAIAAADLVLWLGDEPDAPERPGVILVHSKADLGKRAAEGALRVSAISGQGVPALIARLVDDARGLLPRESELAINMRQREALSKAARHLRAAAQHSDLLLTSEELRVARAACDAITGRGGVEDMLDALFGRFCVGK